MGQWFARGMAAGVCFLLLGPLPVRADEDLTAAEAAGRAPAPGYGHVLVSDVRHVLAAPVRWQEDDWRTFGLISLGILGTAVVDRPVRDFFQDHQSSTADHVANLFEPFGAEYSFVALGGFYLSGLAADDENARAVAEDGFAASVIASGIITPALKFTVGRSRPNANDGPFHFRPFTSSASFPSGHATQAFAVAAVIADHYESLWVKSTAYGVASLAGMARMYHDKHWASDVVAGGAIGITVGRSVVALNDREQGSPHLTVAPLIQNNARGVELTYDF
jgi:membrane-associated phospholipid phosphatase